MPSKAVNQASMLSNMSWKLSNLDTKIRINEQNLISERRRVQLINKNLLDLKTEIRDKLDSVTTQSRELKQKMTALEKKVAKVEVKLSKKFAGKDEVHELKKFSESFNMFGTDMSKTEADKILDEILKKTEA